MKRLVNISSDEDSFMVEPTHITLVEAASPTAGATVYGSEGRVLGASEKSARFPMDSVVTKLKAAGAKLEALPVRRNDKSDTAAYFCPAAVSYIITSGGIKGETHVILGLKGNATLESYRVSKDELADMISAVKAAKKMMELPPEKAGAVFGYNSGATYVDASAIVRIVEEGDRLCVTLGEGGGNLRLTSRRATQAEIKPADTTGMSDDDLFAEVTRRREAVETALRRALAVDLAAENGKLIAIPGSAAHVSADGINSVSTYVGYHGDHILEIGFKQLPCVDDRSQVRFNTAAELKKAEDALTNPPRKPKPFVFKG